MLHTRHPTGGWRRPKLVTWKSPRSTSPSLSANASGPTWPRSGPDGTTWMSAVLPRLSLPPPAWSSLGPALLRFRPRPTSFLHAAALGPAWVGTSLVRLVMFLPGLDPPSDPGALVTLRGPWDTSVLAQDPLCHQPSCPPYGRRPSGTPRALCAFPSAVPNNPQFPRMFPGPRHSPVVFTTAGCPSQQHLVRVDAPCTAMTFPSPYWFPS